jgi:hypothetical protein
VYIDALVAGRRYGYGYGGGGHEDRIPARLRIGGSEGGVCVHTARVCLVGLSR